MKQLIKHLTPKPVRQLIRQTWKSLEVDMPLCEQNNLLPSFSALGEETVSAGNHLHGNWC